MNSYPDRNCLTYWFARIEEAGLPVPKTRVVRIPTDSIYVDLMRPIDGRPFQGPALAWLEVLKLAVAEIGVPCFLRTGQTSGKHEWEKTCHVPTVESVPAHVLSLIDFSEAACIPGLDWRVWAVRELLPTKPLAIIYRAMPLCREYRCFVDGGELLCSHPYWPWEPVVREFWGDSESIDIDSIYHAATTVTDRERQEIEELAKRAGAACGGRWSVDILDTERGWYVTDMAVMEESWHWPGCLNAPENGGV